MLSKDMTFPAVFDCTGNKSAKIVLLHKINDNRFAGYTTAGYSDPLDAHNRDKWCGVWDANGKCVFTDAASNTMLARVNRTIVFAPKPEQAQYEKLTIDQRAILQLIYESPNNTSNRQWEYLVDTLKVDVNLATVITDYAIKKDFK